jgi:hypothetical protein
MVSGTHEGNSPSRSNLGEEADSGGGLPSNFQCKIAHSSLNGRLNSQVYWTAPVLLEVLASEIVNPLDVAVPALLNDLAMRPGPLAVILDDYHVLADRRIHEGVEFLLAYLPPQVRLIFAGRFDPPLPWARFRARGELTEIRAEGLRFTVEEASGLVGGVTGTVLAPSEMDRMVARTEGWAVGLKLMALALRRSEVDSGLGELLSDDLVDVGAKGRRPEAGRYQRVGAVEGHRLDVAVHEGDHKRLPASTAPQLSASVIRWPTH